jgi:hypothetical protein
MDNWFAAIWFRVFVQSQQPICRPSGEFQFTEEAEASE